MAKTREQRVEGKEQQLRTENRERPAGDKPRVPPGREQARADFVETQRLEASRRCCKNCAYAVRPKGRWRRLILLQFPGLLACLNHPDSGGEMRQVACEGVCRNFRHRCRPPIRLDERRTTSHGFIDHRRHRDISRWRYKR